MRTRKIGDIDLDVVAVIVGDRGIAFPKDQCLPGSDGDGGNPKFETADTALE